MMNILIIGKPSQDLITLVKKSKYTDKIYTAINGNFVDFPNIEYRNFDELIQKSLALKIDIGINIDKTMIASGISEFFESKRINLISVNKKWLNLESSRLSAKKLLKHYNINTSEIIRIPLVFPVMVKTDSPEINYVAGSMQEVVAKMEELEGLTTFFTEYIKGQTFILYSIWDKKNIKYFCNEKILTEVQKDRLDLLKTKLNFMFSDEKANFTGIFSTNLIWYKNNWYVEDFNMCTALPAECIEGIDFVYVLNSAIYQKLDEL